ncbi:MAG TPA: Fe-S-containing hydro-lyase [Armatimonadetes bacterium]|nr:Fe-S-containing hydro-lyase [Armatimonadota bacterium]
MSGPKRIKTPLTDEVVLSLRAGDKVLLSGVVYGARDAAHRKMVDVLRRGEPLPVNLSGQVIYYVGPTPAPPGRAVGAAGPTTAGRMDPYVEPLLSVGLKGMVGKGRRSPEVVEALRRYKAIYFGAVGGLGALLSRHIKRAEIVAYEDLGPEALWLFEFEDFPCFVVNDAFGGDLYEEAKRKWRR